MTAATAASLLASTEDTSQWRNVPNLDVRKQQRRQSDPDLREDAVHNSAAEAARSLSLAGFVAAELGWGTALPWWRPGGGRPAPGSDFLRVPLRMEQFLLFAHAMCLDLFLFQFTLLPLRCAWSAAAAACTAAAALVGGVARLPPALRLSRAGVYDLLKLVIIVLATAALGMVQVSRVYHYIRGEAVIKLYVIFNILEIVDKLCATVGTDIMDSLYRTVRDSDELAAAGAWLTGTAPPAAAAARGPVLGAAAALLRLLGQAALAAAYVTLHACVIFVQIVCLNVALNARNNSLLTLLVSNNFVELKGSVFKRFEPANLFQVACADGVERFQLAAFLALILLQEGATPPLLWAAGLLWVAELAVDAVKHSFVARFNRLHADLYATFTAIVAHDYCAVRGRMAASLDPTHACVRRLGLAPVPLACVVLRVLLSRGPAAWLPRLFVTVAAAAPASDEGGEDGGRSAVLGMLLPPNEGHQRHGVLGMLLPRATAAADADPGPVAASVRLVPEGWAAAGATLAAATALKLVLSLALLAYSASVIRAQRARLQEAASTAAEGAAGSERPPSAATTGATTSASPLPASARRGKGDKRRHAGLPPSPCAAATAGATGEPIPVATGLLPGSIAVAASTSSRSSGDAFEAAVCGGEEEEGGGGVLVTPHASPHQPLPHPRRLQVGGAPAPVAAFAAAGRAGAAPAAAAAWGAAAAAASPPAMAATPLVQLEAARLRRRGQW